MSPRSTLAVFAHFDPGGAGRAARPALPRGAARRRRPRRHRLHRASWTTSAAPTLRGHGELVERENVGYDFYSWKTGLDHAGDWSTSTTAC